MDKKGEKFLKLAVEEAGLSGCVRSKRGAVMVVKDIIVGKAFNCPLPENGVCQKGGCLRDRLKLGLGKELEKCRAIHAEAKVITEAAKNGVSLDGAVAYITCMPCINCAKLMIGAGIKEVYYLDEYGDKTSMKLLEGMGVKIERIKLEGDKKEERLRDASGQ